jgi:hypothetical protein
VPSAVSSVLKGATICLALGATTGCAAFFRNVAESFENPAKQEVERMLAETQDAVAKAFAVKEDPLTDYEGAQAVFDHTRHCLDLLHDVRRSDEYEPESQSVRTGGRSWPFTVQLGDATASVEEAFAFCSDQMTRLGEASFDACGMSGFVLEQNAHGGSWEAALLKPDWNPRLDYLTEKDRTLDYEPIDCSDMQERVVTANASNYAEQLQAVCGDTGVPWAPNGWRTFEESATHTVRVMDVRCYLQEERRWYATDSEDALRTYR